MIARILIIGKSLKKYCFNINMNKFSNMSATKFLISGLLLNMLSCSNHYLELSMNIGEKANYILDKMIKDSDTPGVQYLIVNSDSIVFEYVGGFSDLEKNTVLTTSTTFNAFSVTKTFTALAILQLEADGKLNIDDKVQEHLDYLPYKSYFTIRQLLSHTSGLPNPIPIRWIHLLNENFNYKEFIKNVLDENKELENQPGEEYSYSNIGYLLLGEIIEKTSGEDYQSYIRNHIINKLSLSNTDYLGFVIQDTTEHAHGYIRKWSFLNIGLNFIFDKNKFMDDTYDGWSQFKYFYMNGYAFGGLIGNARGFAKYLQSLLKENKLITKKERLKFYEIQKLKNGTHTDMCLSWFKGKLGKEIYYTHAGGGGGYYCEIRLYPELNMASVIMFNKTGVSDDRILDKIDKLFIPNDKSEL